MYWLTFLTNIIHKHCNNLPFHSSFFIVEKTLTKYSDRPVNFSFTFTVPGLLLSRSITIAVANVKVQIPQHCTQLSW